MKFIICGGGSGGHVTPAIAIYEALKARFVNAEFLFVGRRGGSENSAYSETGERLHTVNMSGINGKSPIKAIKGVLAAIEARKGAKKLLKEEHPDAIIGTGGYVCWPILSAGAELGIPTVIHESNAYPGLTTRLLCRRADRVLLNYGEAAAALPQKHNVKVVGNPVRKRFSSTDRRLARKKLGVRDGDIMILSFGGSLGARMLNETVLELMRCYSAKNPRIKHLHATGRSHYDETNENAVAAPTKGDGCVTVPYIDDMASAMSAADIIISRAGAMTVSEICAVGVASILIPSPNVADDHQTKNARYMQTSGASLMIEEKDLTVRALLDTVRSLEAASERRRLANAARSLAKEDAASLIVSEIECVLGI